MKTFYVNVRYLIVPVMTVLTIYGLFLGGIFAWTGVFLFGLNIILDTVTKNIHLRADFDENGDSYGIKTFQYVVMYLMLPIFIVLQCALAWNLYQFTTSSAVAIETLVGAILSTGLWAGLGIIYGHELSHNKKEGFSVSRAIMALSGASHFTYAHVYQHHLELGHQNDPATAPRGRNVYWHTWLSHFGQSKFSFDLEKQKLERHNKSFFSLDNKWILGYLYSLPSIILFVWSGGIIGIVALVIVWGISNFLLEALNFMGHYGLIREAGKPVEHRHSWDNDNLFTSWFFIEIGRQGDHHVRGETYFWELDEVGAPNYEIGYFTLFLLTLIPPLFRKYTQKYLDEWDLYQASNAEKQIAKDYYENSKHLSNEISVA